jgi:ACS family sodium-dependent inorganic phosphate cotransporter
MVVEHFHLSVRWQTINILFLATLITFLLRVCMSVTALQMKVDFGWSENDLGMVLSSYYWGYSLGQVPSILIAEKFGGKLTLGIGVFIPSLLNFLVPTCSKFSVSYTVTLQALIGIAQSAAFPSCYYLFPRWIPLLERTIMVSYCMSGIFLVLQLLSY